MKRSTLQRRTPLRSKAPPPRPARQWDGPAPTAQRPARGSGLLAAALALPALEVPQDGPSDAAGRRYMARVAELPCRLCLRLGRGASDFLTAALCPACHTGRHGLHGDKSLLRLAGVDELDLLADTIAGVAEGHTK